MDLARPVNERSTAVVIHTIAWNAPHKGCSAKLSKGGGVMQGVSVSESLGRRCGGEIAFARKPRHGGQEFRLTPTCVDWSGIARKVA